jgi:hypothetical protein
MLPVVLGIISAILGNKNGNNSAQPYQMGMNQNQPQQIDQQPGTMQPQASASKAGGAMQNIGTIASLISSLRNNQQQQGPYIMQRRI